MSGCTSSNGEYDYNRIEHPIELSRTINSVLEKDDDWDCDEEFCVYEFKSGSNAILPNAAEKDYTSFMIDSDVFEDNVISVNYNVTDNMIYIQGIFDRQTNWCELSDDAVCKIGGIVNFSEDGMNLMREFRTYILELLFDYITNLS